MEVLTGFLLAAFCGYAGSWYFGLIEGNFALLMLMSFTLLCLARMVSIVMVPLDPPDGLIKLNDPLTSLIYGGKDKFITKDLFFSGHTATMVFVCYFLPTKQERRIALGLSLVLVALLLIQHVHYSLDVAAAPFFTLAAIWIVKKLGII